ncbi:MAG: hypothetical protein SNJ69_08775 [Chloroflexaceae bacterium]
MEEQIAQALEVLDVLLQNSIPVEKLVQHPQAMILMGLLSAYRESPGVAIAAALFVGGTVCVASGVLAWVWGCGWRRAASSRRRRKVATSSGDRKTGLPILSR